MSWLEGWKYRKQITLRNSDVINLDNSVAKISVEHIADKMKEDFEDVRFTKVDGTTLIDFVILERVTLGYGWMSTTGYGNIDIGQSVTIYMYYGKDDAVDQLVCAGGNFDICDNFGDESIDTDLWDVEEDGLTITEEPEGYIRIYHQYQKDMYIKSKAAHLFGPGSYFVARVRFGTATPFQNERISYIGLSDSVAPRSGGEACLIQMVETTWNTFVRISGDTDIQSFAGASIGSWHVFEIYYLEAEVKFYMDGTLIRSVASPNPTENLFLFMFSEGLSNARSWNDDIDYAAALAIDGDGDATLLSLGDEESEAYCYRLKNYLYEVKHSAKEELKSSDFPDKMVIKQIHKDICETVLSLGGVLNQRYRHISTMALNSAAGGKHTVSHVAGSTSVTGFSGLAVNGWADGAILSVKDDVYYYAKILSNTATVVVISNGSDLPALSSDVVMLTSNDSNVYIDISSLKKINWADPIWCILDGNGFPIEKMPLEMQKSVNNISEYDGKVYWYQKGDEIRFALGSGAKLAGNVYVGYYRLPREAIELTDCIDLPIGYHSIAQDKTAHRMLTKKAV